MAISLSLLYYAYLIMVLLFFIFSFFIVYHLLRFGYFNMGSLVLVIVFIAVSAMILIFSWQQLSKVDWNQPIEISSGLEQNGFSNF